MKEMKNKKKTNRRHLGHNFKENLMKRQISDFILASYFLSVIIFFYQLLEYVTEIEQNNWWLLLNSI